MPQVKQLQRAKGAAASGEDGSVIDDDMSDNRSAYTSYTGYTAVTGTTRKDHNDVHQHKLEQKHANRAKEVADLQIILANKEKELKVTLSASISPSLSPSLCPDPSPSSLFPAVPFPFPLSVPLALALALPAGRSFALCI